MPEPVASTSSTYMDEPDMSIFENKTGLAEDMKFLASMPELCDVTFLVGETREPVCAVKVFIVIINTAICDDMTLLSYSQAVLAARSRVFQKLLYQAPSPQRRKEPPPRENKLRLFLKRSSEPLLNLQNAAQQVKNVNTQIPTTGQCVTRFTVTDVLSRKNPSHEPTKQNNTM